jgi:Protein of unknown function (DUF1559)
MPHVSVRTLMLAIAAFAAVLGTLVGPARREIGPSSYSPRGHCQSNLRNIMLALLGYHAQEGALPTGTWPNSDLPAQDRLSWYAAITSYLDEQELGDRIDMTQPWNGYSNASVASESLALLSCPLGTGAARGGPVPTCYIGLAGLGADAPLLPKGHARAGVFGYDRQTTLADIADGLSTTMFVAESGRLMGSWLAGGPPTVRGLDPAQKPYIGPGCQFGGLHQSGAVVAFGDGSARAISPSIDPRVFEALSTIAGGEKLPARWDW